MGAAERSITGHIDFLQVRNGAVHILDYKPDARTNKPIAQLAIYALALTRLIPGLKLFDIKCAWFNEQEYCEFFPRKLFERPTSGSGTVWARTSRDAAGGSTVPPMFKSLSALNCCPPSWGTTSENNSAQSMRLDKMHRAVRQSSFPL